MLFTRKNKKERTSPVSTPTPKAMPAQSAPSVTWKNGKYCESYKIINNAFAALATHSDKEYFYKKAKELEPTCNLRGKEIPISFNYTTPLSPSIPENYVESILIEGFKIMLNASLQNPELFKSAKAFYNNWALYLSPENIIGENETPSIKEMFEHFKGFLRSPDSQYIG